jgi:hypothetical protein
MVSLPEKSSATKTIRKIAIIASFANCMTSSSRSIAATFVNSLSVCGDKSIGILKSRNYNWMGGQRSVCVGLVVGTHTKTRP